MKKGTELKHLSENDINKNHSSEIQTVKNFENENDKMMKTKNNPKENKEKEEEKNNEGYETGVKRNLMFEEKKISPMKLYCHLSGRTEIILMIFGFIGAMAAGVASPLLTYLFGDTFNEFTGVTEELIEFVPPETLVEMFDKFENNIDKMVKKLFQNDKKNSDKQH